METIRRPGKHDDILNYAIPAGHLNVVEWLYNRDGYLGSCKISIAVASGNLELAKWLHDRGVKLDTSWYEAVSLGRFDLLEWLHENKCPWNYGRSPGDEGRDLRITAWLWERGYGYNIFNLLGAFKPTYLGILEYYLDHGFKWQDAFTKYAVEMNRSTVLEMLRSRTLQ